MEFGKIEDISKIDFRLPPDAPGTAEDLQRTAPGGEPLYLYLGGTGWNMKEWVGTVYPKGARSKDYLRYYALQFNTIELNTTHYRIPDPDTIRRWYGETTADFRFCPKVPQTISHSSDLGLGGGQVTAFCEAVLQLEEKLGCCFLQLSPYSGPGRSRLLARFLDQWPEEVPLALELRNEQWFADEQVRQDLFQMLSEFDISAVITDVAGRRDVLHMRVTNPCTMVRFVGNGLHPTDYSRVDEWMERLLDWHRLGLRTAYLFLHEPDNLLAPRLVRYVYERMQHMKSVETRGPQFFEEDRQMRLF